MQCPFLRETQVESCRHSLFRKLIVRNPESLASERCSTDRHVECGLYAGAPQEFADFGRCPYLDESLVQYCAAAPVQKYIPEFQLWDPWVTREFTIRDALTHRSGLGLGAGRGIRG